MADFKERLSKSLERMEQAKAKLNDASESAEIAGMLAKDKIDEKIKSLKGDIVAGNESARIVAERGKSRFNSAILKAQMSVEAAKESIEKKTGDA